jgi:hypothetical protein
MIDPDFDRETVDGMLDEMDKLLFELDQDDPDFRVALEAVERDLEMIWPSCDDPQRERCNIVRTECRRRAQPQN